MQMLSSSYVKGTICSFFFFSFVFGRGEFAFFPQPGDDRARLAKPRGHIPEACTKSQRRGAPHRCFRGLADVAIYEGSFSEARCRLLEQGSIEADVTAKKKLDRAADKYAALAYAQLRGDTWRKRRRPAQKATGQQTGCKEQHASLRSDRY